MKKLYNRIPQELRCCLNAVWLHSLLSDKRMRIFLSRKTRYDHCNAQGVAPMLTLPVGN